MSKENEIRIRHIPTSLKNDLDRLADRAGVTTTTYVKTHLRGIVDNNLKNQK